MRRGTTPTHVFTVPVDASTITLLSLVYAQNGNIIIEKLLSDVVASGNTITATLSEEETLKFFSGAVEIQLRIGIGTKRMASEIIKASVGDILKGGKLA